MQLKFFVTFFILSNCLLYTKALSQETHYLTQFHKDAGNPKNVPAGTPSSWGGWKLEAPGIIAENEWSRTIRLPFSFDYFGVSYSNIKISANGLLTFDLNSLKLVDTNSNLPSRKLPNNTIACFWDDFTANAPISKDGKVYSNTFGTAPNRQFWISSINYEMGNPSNDKLFYACVFEETTNTIYIVDRGRRSSPAISSTVGIQLNDSVAFQIGDSLIDLRDNGLTSIDHHYYEFIPFQAYKYDVALDTAIFYKKSFCTGELHSFDLKFRNKSYLPLNSIEIIYGINDSIYGTKKLENLALQALENKIIKLDSIQINGLGPSDTFFTYCQSPNGNIDLDRSNDSLKYIIPIGLSGNFTINSTQKLSNINYHSLQNLINDLENKGICSNVNISIIDSVLEEQIVFSKIPGSSEQRKIHINGKMNQLLGNPTDVDRPIILISGADYITLDSLSIKSKSNKFGIGLLIHKSAHHIEFTNSVIELNTLKQNFGDNACISLGGSKIGTENHEKGKCEHISIENNKLLGSDIGLVISGTVNGNMANISIINNKIYDFFGSGINLSFVENVTVKSNDISRPNRSNLSHFQGIGLFLGVQDARIDGNRIHNTNGSGEGRHFSAQGISVYGSGIKGRENYFVNNLIYDFNTDASIVGLSANGGGDNIRFVHNTIALSNFNSSGDYIDVINIGDASGITENVIFQNNLIYTAWNSPKWKTGISYRDGHNSTSISSDYNVFYFDNIGSSDQYFGQWGNNYVDEFSDWKRVNNKTFDQNSKYIDPLLLNLTKGMLQPMDTSLKVHCPIYIGAEYDFYGNRRSGNRTVPGAIASPLYTNDIGIISHGSTTLCQDKREAIMMEVFNAGTDTVFSIPIKAEIIGDYTLLVDSIIQDTLSPREFKSIVIGKIDTRSGKGILINGQLDWSFDENRFNDTFSHYYSVSQLKNSLPNDTSFCKNSEVNITLKGGKAKTYLWSNNSSQDSLRIKNEGTYTLLKMDEYGCSIFETFVLSSRPLPEFSLGNDTCIEPTELIKLFDKSNKQFKSYLWSNGDTTRQIIVSKEGIFTLTVTDKYGCSNSDEINVSTCLGLDQKIDNRIKVYPNPTSNKLIMQVNFLGQEGKCIILNTKGKELLYKEIISEKSELDISHLENGIYFIKFLIDDNVIYKRIVKD